MKFNIQSYIICTYILLESFAAMVVRGPNRSSSDRPHLHCTYCDYGFHTRETCHKLHGCPIAHHFHGQPSRPPLPPLRSPSSAGSTRSNLAASSSRSIAASWSFSNQRASSGSNSFSTLLPLPTPCKGLPPFRIFNSPCRTFPLTNTLAFSLL